MSQSFRPVVLSGGGSRGAYGAGVLFALRKFQGSSSLETNFYCGTSVGALNAVLAAQGDLNQLLKLCSTLTTKDVIGTKNSDVGLSVGWKMWTKQDPFHHFDNKALAKLIAQHASYEKLTQCDAHVAICVTNYTTGNLETFYFSSLIDQFVKYEIDNCIEERKRRFSYYKKIESQPQLEAALLASAAIPFFFPPVKIGDDLYVDGGVGNNTCTRQAAFFCRYVDKMHLGKTLPTICVINDPTSFAIANGERMRGKDVILRTIDLFQHELVTDTLLTWQRINSEAKHLEDQQALLLRSIREAPGLTDSQREHLQAEINTIMGKVNAATPRLNLELWEIRPNPSLEVEDSLTFAPDVSRKLRHRGTFDFINKLVAMNKIDMATQQKWDGELNQEITKIES